MMIEVKIDLLIFSLKSGQQPFSIWLNSLRDKKARAKIDKRLTRLQLGNFGDHKSLGGGVSELRISEGPGYRIYYGTTGNTVVILLCGGSKASQSKDINMAKTYWSYYKIEKHHAN